ncbi:hypothetical protein Hanom_Chr14g01251771 [Helianthus anomalus]
MLKRLLLVKGLLSKIRKKTTTDGVEKNKDRCSEKKDDSLKHGIFGPSFAAHGGWYAQNATDINKNTNASGSSFGLAQGGNVECD